MAHSRGSSGRLHSRLLAVAGLLVYAALAPRSSALNVGPLSTDGDGVSNGNENGTSNSGDGNNADENGGSTLQATEKQVARLMEEDMDTAMQYLQGKGLCLMPISLASVISSATSSSFRSTIRPVGSTGGPPPEGGSPTSQQLVNGTAPNDSLTIKNGGRQ